MTYNDLKNNDESYGCQNGQPKAPFCRNGSVSDVPSAVPVIGRGAPPRGGSADTAPTSPSDAARQEEGRPSKPRGGGPRANSNRTTHSLRGSKLPADAKHIERAVSRLREDVEAAVMVRDGSVGLYAAAVTQSICRHEARARLLLRWLRHPDASGLSIPERATLLSQLSDATTKRDACMKVLGLDCSTKAVLLPHQIPVNAQQAPGTRPTATGDRQATPTARNAAETGFETQEMIRASAR